MSKAVDTADAEAGADAAILRVTNVRRVFGGLVACDVDELEMERNSIVALIGPNGAGKTTFFNAITGFERKVDGNWQFEGVDLSGRPAYAIARTGMVRTFQSARVFPRLSVLDNVVVAARGQKGESFVGALLPPIWRQQERDLRERAQELLEWVGLGAKARDFAGTLSGGQRKLLELARAVMVEPRLLMLDEPMAGVNPALRQALLDRITALPARGITVMFVEHDMDVVRTISDRVVCMAEGRIVADDTPTNVASNPAVIDAYLGRRYGDLVVDELDTPPEPFRDEDAT